MASVVHVIMLRSVLFKVHRFDVRTLSVEDSSWTSSSLGNTSTMLNKVAAFLLSLWKDCSNDCPPH